MRLNQNRSFSICLQLLLIGGAIIAPLIASVPTALAEQTYYYTGSFDTHFNAGNQQINTYNVGQTVQFDSKIHVNHPIPVNINTNSVKDIFAISMDRVTQSGGIQITDANLNDSRFTDSFLRTNRYNQNDNQVGYSSQNTPVLVNASWDAFTCGETWIKDTQYQSGKDYLNQCSVTFKQCGIYQIDVDSYYTYANFPAKFQNPAKGYAGDLLGYFFKVNCAKPTETVTPTITPTPVEIATLCTGLTLKDQNEQTIVNGSFVKSSNDSVQNISATISGTSNITPISLDWSVLGTDTNTNKNINESSTVSQKVNTTNGKYTANNIFKFGPFDASGNFGTSATIPSDHNFIFTVIPTLFYMNGSNKVIIQSSTICNANLTTTSTGQVLPEKTTADVSLTKTLITTAPVSVGQNAQFKIVITNTGSEILSTVNFHDDFGNANILTLQSAAGFETLNNQNTDSQNITLLASNGTTSTLDLAGITGFQGLNPKDSVTLTLNFLAQSQGNDCDVAIVNTVSKSGATPTATDHACVTISPTPASPNTGAETGITLSAMGILAAAAFGKKYLLKMMIV